MMLVTDAMSTSPRLNIFFSSTKQPKQEQEAPGHQTETEPPCVERACLNAGFPQRDCLALQMKSGFNLVRGRYDEIRMVQVGRDLS